MEVKSEEYTATMNEKMGGYLTYTHEDGINYGNILDDIMVGSCLQTPADVDRRVGPEQSKSVEASWILPVPGRCCCSSCALSGI